MAECRRLSAECQMRTSLNSTRADAHPSPPPVPPITDLPPIRHSNRTVPMPADNFAEERHRMNTLVLDKKADLAGPGIGDYAELEKILPHDYHSLLSPKETQHAIFHVKRYIEDHLCKELNLMMVEVPLIVDEESGVNDMLDRDRSRTPIQFHISNDREKHPINAQVVQAATKWKRMALKQFGMAAGEGLCTDMRAVRKDYFLDHDHSAYVDQWDWERVITEQRNLTFLKDIVSKIWKVMVGAERYAQELFPQLKDPRYPNLPEKLTFLHTE